MHRRRVQSGLSHISQQHNSDLWWKPPRPMPFTTYILLYVLKSMRPSIYYYDVSWMSILLLCAVLQDDRLQEFDLLGAATVESNGYVLLWATGCRWNHAASLMSKYCEDAIELCMTGGAWRNTVIVVVEETGLQCKQVCTLITII